MKTLIQRVKRAEVRTMGEAIAAIGPGLTLFVGVEKGDTDADAETTARKVAALRIFPGRTPMDRTVAEVAGAVLVVSQFTLVALLKKGNRPSFDPAEAPERAHTLYQHVATCLRETGLEVAQGCFGADMEVELINDGPVTFWLDVREGTLR